MPGELCAKILVCAFVFLFNSACEHTKKLTHSTNGIVARPQSIWVTEWSADGQYFALGGDDSTVWLYNARDYSLLKTYKLNSALKGMSWHPKENMLALATSRGVQLLDLSKDEMTTFTEMKTGGRGISWNASGELLALADGRGIVQIMNKKGKLIRSISKHNNHSYLSVHWHPKKDIIVTASDEIILFDTAGNQLQFIKHRKELTGILTVRWHPSGDFFATGDYGHEGEGIPTLLQFWKEDGTLIKTIQGHHAEIRNLRWSKDGSMLATAADALRIWNKDGELLHSGKSEENLWGVAWSKDGKNIVTGSYANGAVKVWNNRGELIKQLN